MKMVTWNDEHRENLSWWIESWINLEMLITDQVIQESVDEIAEEQSMLYQQD